MKIKYPKISVLMPVYNAEKFLKKAINSILGQTFKDYEFLIINDGSTDNSKKIILSYKDSRIRYYENKINQGVIKTLNRGLRLSKGKYIARMDADDISMKYRLKKQYNFMEQNQQIAVSGTWLKIIGNKTQNNKIWENPCDHNSIKCSALFYSPIFHPTAILRSNIFIKYHIFYNSSYIHAEDYALWVKIMEKEKVANINDVLLYHRIHPNSTGIINSLLLRKNSNKLRVYQLHKLGIHPTNTELQIHQAISSNQLKLNKKNIFAARLWLLKLIIINFNINYYPRLIFSNIVIRKLLTI